MLLKIWESNLTCELWDVSNLVHWQIASKSPESAYIVLLWEICFQHSISDSYLFWLEPRVQGGAGETDSLELAQSLAETS